MPTHLPSGNVIDLGFVSPSLLWNGHNVEVSTELGLGSDHLSIIYELDLDTQKPLSNRYNPDSMDLFKFLSILRHKLEHSLPAIERQKDLDDAIELLCEALILVFRLSTAKRHPCPRSRKWWTQELAALLANSRRAERWFHRHCTPDTRRSWLDARWALYCAISTAKEAAWMVFIHELERANIYDVLNKIQHKPCAVFPSLVDPVLQEVATDLVKRGRILGKAWFGATAVEVRAVSGNGERGNRVGHSNDDSNDYKNRNDHKNETKEKNNNENKTNKNQNKINNKIKLKKSTKNSNPSSIVGERAINSGVDSVRLEREQAQVKEWEREQEDEREWSERRAKVVEGLKIVEEREWAEVTDEEVHKVIWSGDTWKVPDSHGLQMGYVHRVAKEWECDDDACFESDKTDLLHIAAGRCDKDCGATGLYQMVSSLERVAVEKQNIEILVQIVRDSVVALTSTRVGRKAMVLLERCSQVRLSRMMKRELFEEELQVWEESTLGEEWGKTLAQELTDYWLKWVRTIPADREHQSPRIQLIESLCQQIRRDLVSKPRRNSRFRQDSLTDQQDLGCGLIGSCFRPRTRPNMDESSRVLLVSILYPAGAQWLSPCGRSARIQASLRAYPEGFPWVEPVVFKMSGGLVVHELRRNPVGSWSYRAVVTDFVRMLVALELYEIPREEVAGGAVGVVQGGFPREGAQRVRFPEQYPNAGSCSPNWVIVSCQVRHSRVERMGPSHCTSLCLRTSAEGPEVHLRTRVYAAAAATVDLAGKIARWVEPACCAMAGMVMVGLTPVGRFTLPAPRNLCARTPDEVLGWAPAADKMPVMVAVMPQGPVEVASPCPFGAPLCDACMRAANEAPVTDEAPDAEVLPRVKAESRRRSCTMGYPKTIRRDRAWRERKEAQPPLKIET
ncbi:hypothetical protein DFH09DRAFT_1106741 [Mycena vulgaris]|nr:hypothetical protein DFH09DRAFT_1106741 [Mycena vulgaris]